MCKMGPHKCWKDQSMCTSKELQNMEIPFGSRIIEQVMCFTSLEGNLISDNTIDSGINSRRVNADSAFHKQWHSVLSHKDFSIALKMKVFNTYPSATLQD